MTGPLVFFAHEDVEKQLRAVRNKTAITLMYLLRGIPKSFNLPLF